MATKIPYTLIPTSLVGLELIWFDLIVTEIDTLYPQIGPVTA